MLEVWRRRAHCSGMPCTKRPTDTIFYSEEYFMQLDIHSFLASSSFLSLLLPLAYVNNLFLNKTRTKKKKKVTRLLTSSFQGLKNIILMLTPHRGGHEILHAWPRNLTAAQQEIPGTFHGSSQWNHWINFSGSSAPALVTHECTNHQKTSRTFLSEAPCAGVLQSNACYKFVFFFKKSQTAAAISSCPSKHCSWQSHKLSYLQQVFPKWRFTW